MKRKAPEVPSAAEVARLYNEYCFFRDRLAADARTERAAVEPRPTPPQPAPGKVVPFVPRRNIPYQDPRRSR